METATKNIMKDIYASKEDLNNTVEELHEYVTDETCKVSELSKKQAGRLITEMVANYTFQKEYFYNVSIRLLAYLKNIFMYLTIGSLVIMYLVGNQNKYIVTVLCTASILFAIGVFITFAIKQRMEKIIRNMDINARSEITSNLSSAVEGYDGMGDQERQKLFQELLSYAGLKWDEKEE